MAYINDWRTALLYLKTELTNELINQAQVSEPECERIVDAIINAFNALEKQIKE